MNHENQIKSEGQPCPSPSTRVLLRVQVGLRVLVGLAACFVFSSIAASAPPPSSQEAPPIIVIPNVRVATEGVIAGGQPTPEMLESAAEYGYSTIVDLRGAGEDRGFDEKTMVEELGMRYVAIPISGASELTEERARELDAALSSSRSDGGMTMVHCASGNRVGALWALRAHYVDGTPAEEAFDLGVNAGMTGLSEAVRAQLGLAPETAAAEETESQEPREQKDPTPQP